MTRCTIAALFVGCSLFLATTSAAAEPQGRLAPLGIFDFEFAADPQISPDGMQVVYVRQAADVMTDKRYSNLWLVNADGSDHRALTNGRNNVTHPRWSPDGKRLVYLSDDGGTSQIRLRWMDNGQTTTLTNVE